MFVQPSVFTALFNECFCCGQWRWKRSCLRRRKLRRRQWCSAKLWSTCCRCYKVQLYLLEIICFYIVIKQAGLSPNVSCFLWMSEQQKLTSKSFPYWAGLSLLEWFSLLSSGQCSFSSTVPLNPVTSSPTKESHQVSSSKVSWLMTLQ